MKRELTFIKKGVPGPIKFKQEVRGLKLIGNHWPRGSWGLWTAAGLEHSDLDITVHLHTWTLGTRETFAAVGVARRLYDDRYHHRVDRPGSWARRQVRKTFVRRYKLSSKEHTAAAVAEYVRGVERCAAWGGVGRGVVFRCANMQIDIRVARRPGRGRVDG